MDITSWGALLMVPSILILMLVFIGIFWIQRWLYLIIAGANMGLLVCVCVCHSVYVCVCVFHAQYCVCACVCTTHSMCSHVCVAVTTDKLKCYAALHTIACLTCCMHGS